MLRMILNCAVLLTMLTCCAGCSGCVATVNPYTETRAFEVDHVPSAPLRVTTVNGTIEVRRESGATKVGVTAELRGETLERLKAAVVVADREAEGTLVLSVEWPGGSNRGREGCTFKVVVPEVRGVEAKSSNGAIKLVGLGGNAQASTSNGAVSVEDQGGNVNVQTSNGRVTVVNAAGSVTTRTSNGQIVVQRAAGQVKAQTSNSTIKVDLLPDAAGPVDLQSSNGGVTLAVGPGFKGRLTAGTSNGRVNAEGLTGVTILETGKTSAKLRFGGGTEDAESSRIKTSNSSVTIKMLGT